MESLALIVAILFASALLGGPIALALTFLRLKRKRNRLIKRFGVTLFATWGGLTALQFAIANVPIFPRLIGVAGLVFSILALKREFAPKPED